MTRGEVVEIDWPYSDLTGSEKRPEKKSENSHFSWYTPARFL